MLKGEIDTICWVLLLRTLHLILWWWAVGSISIRLSLLNNYSLNRSQFHIQSTDTSNNTRSKCFANKLNVYQFIWHHFTGWISHLYSLPLSLIGWEKRTHNKSKYNTEMQFNSASHCYICCWHSGHFSGVLSDKKQ